MDPGSEARRIASLQPTIFGTTHPGRRKLPAKSITLHCKNRRLTVVIAAGVTG